MTQELEFSNVKGQIVGYIRVSTELQNPERQLNGYPVDKTFIDHASGKDTNRPQFQQMMNYVRQGDMVVVHSMDRLCRNVEDLLITVRYLNKNGVKIKFLHENLSFEGENSPLSIMFLTIMGAVSQFERAIIRERILEGVAIAKAKGKFKGRAPAFKPEQYPGLKEKLDLKIPYKKIASMYGVSQEVIYKYARLIRTGSIAIPALTNTGENTNA